jgi:hypothetical protein
VAVYVEVEGGEIVAAIDEWNRDRMPDLISDPEWAERVVRCATEEA